MKLGGFCSFQQLKSRVLISLVNPKREKMPPRMVKRGGASSGTKRTRSTRGATAKQQPEVSEETVKAEEVKPLVEADNKPIPAEVDHKSDVNGLVSATQSKFVFHPPLLTYSDLMGCKLGFFCFWGCKIIQNFVPLIAKIRSFVFL